MVSRGHSLRSYFGYIRNVNRFRLSASTSPDLRDVVWAFATRAHPEHGEVHFSNLPAQQLSVYLSSDDAHSYSSGKAIHNCLLADRFLPGERPVKGSFENGWPPEIQQLLLDRWAECGYATAGPA